MVVTPFSILREACLVSPGEITYRTVIREHSFKWVRAGPRMSRWVEMGAKQLIMKEWSRNDAEAEATRHMKGGS